MARRQEERSRYNFFELYPSNPSLAQYLQDLSTNRFERTSDEPEGSIWGTYKPASTNESPQTRFDEDSMWMNVRNAHYARLKTHKKPTGLVKPAYAPEHPPRFVPHPPCSNIFVGTGAARCIHSGRPYCSHGLRTPQHALAHGHSHLVLTNNTAESHFCPAVLSLRNPFATGMNKISFNSEKSYACEMRQGYNRLFEDFVADTTPLSLTDSTSCHETTDHESLESQNFVQDANDLANLTTEGEFHLHELDCDCQSSTVATSMTSLQSDPAGTLERSDVDESASYLSSPTGKDGDLDTSSPKDRDAHEVSLPRHVNASSLKNARRFYLQELCNPPACRDGSFALKNMHRKFSRKTSSPVLNISTSSLSSSPEFQSHQPD